VGSPHGGAGKRSTGALGTARLKQQGDAAVMRQGERERVVRQPDAGLIECGTAGVAGQFEIGLAIQIQPEDGAGVAREGGDAQPDGLAGAADECECGSERVQQEVAIGIFRIEVCVEFVRGRTGTVREPRGPGGRNSGGDKGVRIRSGDKSGGGGSEQEGIPVQHAVKVARDRGKDKPKAHLEA